MPRQARKPTAMADNAPLSPVADPGITLKEFETTVEELRRLGAPLQASPLRISQPFPHLPTSMEEVKLFVQHSKVPVYFADTQLRIAISNPDARKFVDFDAFPERKRVLALVDHIAKNFLPEQSSGRFPRQDFITQQYVLSLLAKDGIYQLPPALLTIAKGGDGREPYQSVRIDAQNIFSLDGKFLGLLCQLDIRKLDKETYLGHRQRDQLVSPLPEELLAMARISLDIQQKALQQLWEAARLKSPVEPQAEPSVIERPTLPTKEDLKKLLNIEAFERAVKGLGNSIEDKELMRLADDFIKNELRQIIQRKIKLTLWGNEDLPGTVTFNTYLSHENNGYIRAQTGKNPTHTAPIRSLTPDELKEFKAQLTDRKETHQERVTKPSTAKNRSRA